VLVVGSAVVGWWGWNHVSFFGVCLGGTACF